MTLEEEFFWTQFLDALGAPVTEANLAHVTEPANWEPPKLSVEVSISKIPYQRPRGEW